MSIDIEIPLARHLLERLEAAPEAAFLTFEGKTWSVAALAARSFDLAAALASNGGGRGTNIAVMLDSDPDHVAALLAVSLLGAVWVPVGPRLQPANITPMLARTQACIALVAPAYRARLGEAGFSGPMLAPAEVAHGSGANFRPDRLPVAEDIRTIMFTSGTTGAPKGTVVTERMLMAAARFASEASRAGPEETYLLWEPLGHIGGAQMVPMALVSGARLAQVPGFSASRFWAQAKEAGATRIHYLGGILDMLWKQPESAADRDHAVQFAFGAGAKPSIWRAFERRFALSLVEVYGQTEASSFTTINHEGLVGSVGRLIAPFTAELRDAAGRPVADGEPGELVLKSDPPGLITPGYLGEEETTRAAKRGGWLHTGDILRRDDKGRLFFVGRVKDMIRRRGENVPATMVEEALAAHPGVAECAVIGVPAEIGEEEILAYVRPLAAPAALDLAELLASCTTRLPDYALPRYVRLVDDFPRTPSMRIAKGRLARDTLGAFDREADGRTGRPCFCALPSEAGRRSE
jgi:crotonobetaine/carnitine-CoA ligase